MITYKIKNLWDFDSCPNFKIWKICYFSKLNNFRNLMIVEIIRFGKFLGFSKLRNLDFPKAKIFVFAKLQIF